MKRLMLFTFAAATVTTTAFAAPLADGTFRGHTSQGFSTKLVYTGGQVQSVRIPWKATRCTPRTGYEIKFPRFNYRNDPGGPIEQTADGRRFHDSGRVVDGPRNNRAVVNGSMRGHFASDTRVVGTQRIRVRTNDRYGRHSCTAKMRWSAKLVTR